MALMASALPETGLMAMPNAYDVLLEQAQEGTRTRLRRHTPEKAVGPCPDCGGDDRFVVWLHDQMGWCSHCSLVVRYGEHSKKERREMAERNRAKVRAMTTRLRREMAQKSDVWKQYHRNLALHPRAYGLWEEQGITREELVKYGLGYAPSCPTYPDSDSLTMPVFFDNQLVDIRHRLLKLPEDGSRYRSHMARLRPHPYNLDAIKGSPERVVVVGGEKKAIVLDSRTNERTVGLPGILLFRDLFDAYKEEYPNGKPKPALVYALDPAETGQAARLARASVRELGTIAYVADLFEDPDDMVNNYGIEPLLASINMARRLTA